MSMVDRTQPSTEAFRMERILRSEPDAMRCRTQKVIAVMPAYNAASTLERTLADFPPGSADEVILVDDHSKDDTVAIARRMGLTVIEHAANKGYGGNQKTCYREALGHVADIIVMIHPDYQYDHR